MLSIFLLVAQILSLIPNLWKLFSLIKSLIKQLPDAKKPIYEKKYKVALELAKAEKNPKYVQDFYDELKNEFKG